MFVSNVTIVYLNKLCFFLCAFQAFKKIDTDKKKEDIDRMKSKYGLSTPEKKWTFIPKDLDLDIKLGRTVQDLVKAC